MQTVGSRLREVRESLGIPLDEAANVTRIGKNYLIAIEDDKFDKLPSPAYVKGFLRVYAGYLGLSGDDIVAMYDQAVSSEQDPPSPDVVRPKEIPISRNHFPALLLRLLPILAISASIAALFYFFAGKEEKTQQAFQVQAAKPVAPPVLPQRSTAANSAKTASVVSEGPQMEKTASSTPMKTGIILKLKVNQDCWLNITIDGTMSQEYDLKAGDLIEWKGEKTFALDLGNAGGVEAELNGRPLASFGGPGKTAHVLLTGETS